VDIAATQSLDDDMATGDHTFEPATHDATAP
jgi:hypothetical protein